MREKRQSLISSVQIDFEQKLRVSDGGKRERERWESKREGERERESISTKVNR